MSNPLDKLASIRMITDQRQGMFHTPETPKEATKWLETQRTMMPTGIAFMIGFNYALRQVEKALDGELVYDVKPDDLDTAAAEDVLRHTGGNSNEQL